MPWAAAAMQIGGKIGGAIAKDGEMRAQEATHKYNASVSNQAALDAERDSRHAANQQRKQGERLKGTQRAGYGASGVVLDTGSPLEVAVSQAGELEMAALDREIAGAREGQQHRMQRDLELTQAKNVKQARRLAMAGAVLGVGTSMFNSFNGGGMGKAKSSSLGGSSLGGGMASAAGK